MVRAFPDTLLQTLLVLAALNKGRSLNNGTPMMPLQAQRRNVQWNLLTARGWENAVVAPSRP
jgi:hypothetical protein